MIEFAISPWLSSQSLSHPQVLHSAKHRNLIDGSGSPLSSILERDSNLATDISESYLGSRGMLSEYSVLLRGLDYDAYLDRLFKSLDLVDDSFVSAHVMDEDY